MKRKACGHPGRLVFVIDAFDGRRDHELTFYDEKLTGNLREVFWCSSCGAIRLKRHGGKHSKWMRPARSS